MSNSVRLHRYAADQTNLGRLSEWMINLEDASRRDSGYSVGARIESGAEDEYLSRTVSQRVAEQVVGESCARYG